MALWDKLKVELDRAGRVAQSALDESKIRLEAFRARQLADKSAQALGWAIYHARQRGESLDEGTLGRLLEALAERDREVTSLEARLKEAEAGAQRSGSGGTTPPASGTATDEAPANENPSPS